MSHVLEPAILSSWLKLISKNFRILTYEGRSLSLLKGGRQKAADQYLKKSTLFANNVCQKLSGRKFDLVINSDHITLEAGARIAALSGAKRIYDAIEIPRLDMRAGSAYDRMAPQDLSKIHSVESAFIQSSDLITTIGPSIAKWIVENYQTQKVSVVRNCRNFQTPIKSTIKSDLGLQSHERLVLFINGIYPHQGLEQALQALSFTHSNIHLAAMGPAPAPHYLNEICQLAKRENVDKRFHLIPCKPWHEMLDYASGADMGILPRMPERLNNILSLPNRIFELIMARLPVASSDLPDIAEIVKNYKIGQVFDALNPQDIARAVSQTIDKIDQYKDNLETAASELCWETEKMQLLQAVNYLCNRKDHLKVLIISRKDISANNRICRISKTLSQAGNSVTIAAPYPPGNVQRDPAAEYILCNYSEGKAA